MIVCLCYGINDKTIRNLVQCKGIRKVRDLQRHCDAGGDCGACLCELKRVVEEESGSRTSAEQALIASKD